jgi:hypothetical protein
MCQKIKNEETWKKNKMPQMAVFYATQDFEVLFGPLLRL